MVTTGRAFSPALSTPFSWQFGPVIYGVPLSVPGSQPGLLTRNHDDFLELHDVVVAAAGAHPGILISRSDNDPTPDLTLRGIVTAIGKLQSAGVPLATQCYILNHWR